MLDFNLFTPPVQSPKNLFVRYKKACFCLSNGSHKKTEAGFAASGALSLIFTDSLK